MQSTHFIEHHMPPFDTPTARPHYRFGALLTISLASCLLANPSAADAEQPKRNKAGTSESAKKRKVRPKSPLNAARSEESRSERDRRLYRECKGMHNAGACLGYTR